MKTFGLYIAILFLFNQCSSAQNNQAMSNKYYNTEQTEKLKLSNKEWKEVLPKDVYHIAREKGTERAFTGQYWNHYEARLYRCKACGNSLFLSDAKFESSCGWAFIF
jgi:Conserved domain frequently associated with peptide methionine sulfoxide reductase